MRKKMSQFPYPLSVNATGQSKDTIHGQHFVMMNKQREGMMQTEDGEEEEEELHPDIGNRSNMDGYSSMTLDVLCAPLAVGRVEQQFAVTFDNVENADKSVDEQVAHAVTNPLLLLPPSSAITTLSTG